jgi:hypothetical protein
MSTRADTFPYSAFICWAIGLFWAGVLVWHFGGWLWWFMLFTVAKVGAVKALFLVGE